MRIVACCVVLMLTAVVASGAQTAPAGSGKIDACAFLTKEDAAAALGEAVTKGPRAVSTPDGAAACDYEGSGLHRIHLNVIPLTAASAGMYKSLCAQKKKDGLTALGDTTCWYNDKHEELQVLKGTTFFSIELRRNGDPTEPIKAAAKKVYDRVK
jgi:hypothetical protein